MQLLEIHDQEEAQGLVEYSLVLLLVAMFVVASLGLMGTAVIDFFEEFVNRLADL